GHRGRVQHDYRKLTGLHPDRVRAGAAQTKEEESRKLARSIPIGIVTRLHVVFSLLRCVVLGSTNTIHARVQMPVSEVTTVDASLRDWIRLIRPQQWIKNAFVLPPLLFSGKFLDLTADLRAGLAFISFCFLASAVYAWNDILDREGDRQHPTKRMRPVAAGRIGVSAAAWS